MTDILVFRPWNVGAFLARQRPQLHRPQTLKN
jgi:hypothetical protein